MKLILHAFFIFCLIISAPAQARESALEIQEVTSASGLKAWLVEDHSVPVIALQFSFKGIGAALDPKSKQGLSQLTSNTMDEGAGNLDSTAFQKELRDLSISLRFTNSRDHFGARLKTLSKNKARAFELLTLALTKPRFDEEPLLRMRNSNLSRLKSSLSDPDWIAARLLNDKAFANHPYAQNSGGTLTSLANITPDDLRNFTKNLSKDRLVISVAGDITSQELSNILDQIFNTLPETSQIQDIENLSLQNTGRTFLYKKDIPQTIIEIYQPGLDRNDPAYQSAQIMNFILGSSGFGSRLTEEIREKRGLSYGIYTSLYDLNHIDTLSISTSTKNKNVPEVLSVIQNEWEKMKTIPVSAQELTSAKSYLIGSLPLSLTSTDKIASLLLSLQKSNLPINYLDLREEKIKNTTTGDILKIAKQILDPKKFITILVGKPENIKNVQIIETLPNVE